MMSSRDKSNSQLTDKQQATTGQPPIPCSRNVRDSDRTLLLTLLLLPLFNFLVAGVGIAQRSTPDYQPAYGAIPTPANNSVLVESTFDNDIEGWSVVGDGGELTHESSGGRPGGYIHATDQISGDIWFFQAPAKFSGDFSAAYDGVLNFELKQFTPGGKVNPNNFVRISGAGMELVFKFNAIPDTQWTAYRIPLKEQAGWVKSGSGQQPTAEEFRQVLSDMQTLFIRGEHVSGADREGMDNVQLRSDRLVKIHVDPGETYLHISESDEAGAANPINLQTLNLTGISEVALNLTGDFSAGGNQKSNMIGVFSENATLDPESETHRVPGAIDAGKDVQTGNTWYGNEKTDIPEDFEIYNTVITMPSEAAVLFVSPKANYFSDNSDDDNDYAVTIRPAEEISNYALGFAGNAGIRVPHSDELNPDNLTIEAWVNAQSFPTYASVLMKTSSSSWDNGYGLASYSDTKINFFINSWDGNFIKDTLTVNEWSHVAATYDGNFMRLYVNGQLESTKPYSREINHSQGSLYIGKGQGGYHWAGIIDEVRIWDHARSAAEIRSAYKTTLTGDEAGLVGYYPMDSGSGSTVADISGHGNTGTINGAAWTLSGAPIGGKTFVVSDAGTYARDTLSFSWTRATSANAYRLDISTRPDASGIVDQIEAGNTTTYQYPAGNLSEGEQYYARIAASTDGGVTYETFSNFTDGILIDRTAPVPNTPVGRTEGERTVKFTVSGSDNIEIKNFHLQINDSQSFNDPIAEQNLSPGETYQFEGTPGVTYYARAKATDAVGNQSQYSTISAGVTLNPLPDLTVREIDFPQTAVAGNEITLEWTVENTGQGATQSKGWQDAVYFVREHEDGTTERFRLGKVGNASFLNSGQQYRQQASFTIPLQRDPNRTGENIVTKGNYKVTVKTDLQDKEGETNEGNNEIQAGNRINVELPPLPDLKVQQISEPMPVCYTLHFSSGIGYSIIGNRDCGAPKYIGNKRQMFHSMNLGYIYTWTVVNQGDGPAEGTWRGTIYFQQGEGPFDPELATPVTTSIHSGGLAPGDTTDISTGISHAPADYNEGHFYVITDIRGDIFEGVADTNNVYQEPVVTELFPVPPSDLEPVSVSAPAGVKSSDSVSVEWTVKNNGPSNIYPGVWKDRLYLSSDAVFNPQDDTLLDRFFLESEQGDPVPADTQFIVKRKVRLPHGISGSCHLYAEVDATDRINELVPDQEDYEENNVASSAAFEVQLADYPDLKVTSINAPGNANAGATILLEYQVKNDGANPKESGPEWKDYIYLTRDTTDSDRRRLAIEPVEQNIAAGTSYSKTVSVSLPQDLRQGTYYLQIITDQDEDIYEHGEDDENNTTSTSLTVNPEPRPDLRVDSLYTTKTPVGGQPVKVHWRVENHGTSSTEATSWIDRLYLSRDQTLNPDGDEQLHRSVHKGRLSKNGSYTISEDVVFPGNMTGERYLILSTDAGEEGAVRELDPENNIRSERITVAKGPQPDLRVDQVEIKGTPTAAQPLELIVTVTNQGESLSSRAFWWDVWTFSETPEEGGESSEHLHSVSRSGPLAADASYKDTITVEIPHYASGNYYILTHIDSKGQLGENDLTANNRQATPISVTVPPPSDIVVRNVEVPGNAQPGELVEIRYDLVNTGQNPARGQLDDAVYLSEDETLDTGDPRLALKEWLSISLDPSQTKTVRVTARMPDVRKRQRSGRNNAEQREAVGYGLADAEKSIEGDMPGLIPGDYHAIVWGDVRNNIRETDDSNNRTASSTPIGVTVPTLALDSPEQTTIPGNEQARYYKVNVEAEKDLRITLESQAEDIYEQEFEIFVAHDRAPTPANFDAAYQAEQQRQPRVMLPGTEAGTYYVMTRNPYLDDSVDVEILAEAFDFTLFDLSPTAGGNSGRVVATINGAQLDTANTSYYLTNGSTRIDGEIVRILSTMKAEVRFDLRDQPLGTYDVVAEQAGGAEVRLDDAFTVETPVENKLEAAISSGTQLTIPRHRPVSFPVTVENGNNIDADIVVLTLLVPGDHRFSVRSEDFISALMIPESAGIPQESMPEAGLPTQLHLDDGTMKPMGIITLLARDVRIGEKLSAQVRSPNIDRPAGSNLTLGVRAKAYSEQEFVDLIRRKVHNVAKGIQQIIQSDTTAAFSDSAKSSYRSQLKTLLSMSEEKIISHYRNTGLLGEGPITAATGKPVYDPGNFPLFAPDSDHSNAPGTYSNDDGRFHTSSDLSTAVSVGISAGSIVYYGGILASAAAGASVAPAVVLGAGIAVAGSAIFGAITLDSAINNRDWGLTGDIGGVFLPTSGALKDLLVDGLLFTAPHVIDFFESLIVAAFDPNDIIGPPGPGAARWIQRDASLPYKIRFENDPERANVPAKNVVITQPLDSALDARAFRVQRFGFGGRTYEVSNPRAQVTRRIDVRDSLGVYVDFNAGLDTRSGEIFFSFRSIDPGTGRPPTDPTAGFLPPNDSAGVGEGFVKYTIEPLDSAQSGTEIEAQADIVFDRNAPIETPEVFNTVDADIPMSHVPENGAVFLESGEIQLHWEGNDPMPGSGTSNYTLYAAPEGESFQPVASGLRDTTYIYEPDTSTAETFRFFTVAKDAAGNTEVPSEETGTSVTVSVEDSVGSRLPDEFALKQNYPNPFNATTKITYTLPQSSEVTLTVYNLLGQRVRTLVDGPRKAGVHTVNFNPEALASGIYFYRIRAEDFQQTHKMMLIK